ncbi:MAG: hypothetical protein Q8L27_02450, partial [archaeon]|nr:hypothetical protein [archaeon]
NMQKKEIDLKNHKKVMMWVFIFIGISIIWGILGNFMTMFGESDGEHTVLVTAVEYNKGIFFGGYGAYVKTSAESTQEDYYCILKTDIELINQLKDISKSRKMVTLHYSNPLIVWVWDCPYGTSIIREVKD